MRIKSCVAATLAAMAFGAIATTAQAAPGGGLLNTIHEDTARNAVLEQVIWGRRHCTWHRGHYHCWSGHRYHRHHYHYRRWW